ncbi:hypothetical protein GCM10008957_30380 [Deinococcus ruber]|uniref:Uncharacterized protein n=1 Tax=Deinococcus ruber TaxID=1848197 RepID=A0A918CBD3_9DEIO|nr:hypothetical protein GCM10008957_30380 [Deinococcus ruber]
MNSIDSAIPVLIKKAIITGLAGIAAGRVGIAAGCVATLMAPPAAV